METFRCVFVLIFFLQSLSAQGKELEVPKFSEQFFTEKVRLWKPSEKLLQSFPYYWSGFDEEGRPLWILEWGKWDIRKAVEGGKSSIADLDMYIDHMFFTGLESIRSNRTSETVSQVNIILDLNGWPMSQVASYKTVIYILKKFQYVHPTVEHFISGATLINMNYPAKTLVQLLRPVLGSFMERVELLGTQKSIWLPILRSKFPHSQIPEQYGGDKGFKPISVYG